MKKGGGGTRTVAGPASKCLCQGVPPPLNRAIREDLSEVVRCKTNSRESAIVSKAYLPWSPSSLPTPVQKSQPFLAKLPMLKPQLPDSMSRKSRLFPASP
jgi:hypothetical protein